MSRGVHTTRRTRPTGRGGARAVETIERILSEEKTLSFPRGQFRRLWREYLSPMRWHAAAILLATVITSTPPSAFALTGRFLLNRVLLFGQPIPDQDMPDHLWLLLLYFGINMGVWTTLILASLVRDVVILRGGRRLVYELRRDLHLKLQALHVGFYERTPAGRILSRVLDDVKVIHGWVAWQTVMLASGALKIAMGLVMIYWMDWRLAALATPVFPLYAFAYAKLTPRMRRAHIAMRRLNSRMYARSAERIAGIRVVHAFRLERGELASFARHVHDSLRVGMRLVFYDQSLALVAAILIAGATGTVIYIAVSNMWSEAMTVGDFYAFMGGMGLMFGAVRQITSHLTDLQGVSVVIGRVFAFLGEEEQVPPGSIRLDGMTGKIRFEHVTFTYPKQDEPALKDIDFRIGAGERVALMGPSGAGKTTVFQLLLRFYDPQEGKVCVGGVDLADADPRSVRTHVRAVQQEPVLFAGPIADAIAYGRLDASPREIMAAAHHAEIHDFIMSLPLKYETEIGERGVTLSGGQKQRLALATALLTEPEVLLLDDTTSALDAETEARIRATLNRVLEGRTSFIITQRVTTARDCDRIIVLEKGRITQMGTHDELAARDGFYRRVCVQQEAF
jgi:ABC-type multidrug transport system fused ATPase/permease subunit